MLQAFDPAFTVVPLRVASFGSNDDDADGPGPSEGGSGALNAGLAGLRVLIVEDEALISLELEEMFLTLGVEVVGTARSCAEAVRVAEATRPDFLTMDIHLIGERDGVSAAVAIYERFGLRSVFITAFSDAQTVTRAQRARPLGWLAKPVMRWELAAELPVLLADLREK